MAGEKRSVWRKVCSSATWSTMWGMWVLKPVMLQQGSRWISIEPTCQNIIWEYCVRVEVLTTVLWKVLCLLGCGTVFLRTCLSDVLEDFSAICWHVCLLPTLLPPSVSYLYHPHWLACTLFFPHPHNPQPHNTACVSVRLFLLHH
jgi:hypothetical protein